MVIEPCPALIIIPPPPAFSVAGHKRLNALFAPTAGVEGWGLHVEKGHLEVEPAVPEGLDAGLNDNIWRVKIGFPRCQTYHIHPLLLQRPGQIAQDHGLGGLEVGNSGVDLHSK